MFKVRRLWGHVHETNITYLSQNLNRQEADQLAIYKACRKLIRDYPTQVHIVARFEPNTFGLHVLRPNHYATLPSATFNTHFKLLSRAWLTFLCLNYALKEKGIGPLN